MIARLATLRKHPSVFRHLTGLTVGAFDALAADVAPAVDAAHLAALDRPDRERAVGAGGEFALATADQLLAAVVWLRQYPTQETLGFLFGVSDSTAKRAVDRCVPALERAGRDTMRMPDPGAGRREKLPALLADTPGLAVGIDSFEPRTPRPRRRPRADYSGKKKAHTLKSQVAVDEDTGAVVDVSDSAPGPWADIKLLKKSRLLKRLPAGVGAIGDLGSTGVRDLAPGGWGRPPGRSPGGRTGRRRTAGTTERSAGGGSWSNTRSGGSAGSEPYPTSTARTRTGHAARVRAVAGLVNRMLDPTATEATTPKP